jgi:hypothetical protein
MRTPHRIRRMLRYTVVPSTILVTGIFVSASSYSIFNATTSNQANNWSAGTVALQSDGSGAGGASGAAMFAADVSPGTTGRKCITVTSTGTVPSVVKLYGANESDTNGLAGHLTLTVRVGTASSTAGGACTGFSPTATVFSPAHLDTFPTAGYTGGLGTTWSPTGSGTESRVFQFEYTMDSAAPSSTQAGTAHIDFIWESRTT